ncbi:N-acetylmuramoyl-L-alanine amidase-like domain-containing protein [Thermodesulfobacteriota bacterium]
MKSILPGSLLAVLFCFAAVCAEAAPAADGPAPEAAAAIHACTPAQLDRLLKQLRSREPRFQKRLAALARRYAGAPYCADPLENEQEQWLPYDRTNCTMFVLYVAALANSGSLQEARRHMRYAHYRGGSVGFRQRYHFTTDRITDPANSYFSVITARQVTDPSRLADAAVTLNRKKDGGFFFGGRLDGWSRAVTLRYIPRDGFRPGMLKPLPEVTGIAFVKASNWQKGIVVGHEGLLVGGDLYHSSLSAGVCVVKAYFETAFAGSAWEGAILFSINEVPAASGGREWP